MRYGQREARGVEGLTEESLDRAARVIERALADGEGVPGESVRGLVDRLPLDPAAAEAIVARAEVSGARPAALVPASDLAGVARLDAEPSPSIAGGNQRLAEALAAPLGDSLRLRSPARSVAWREDPVRVGTDEGEVEADACVVAVPASVMTVGFDPPLPERHAEALGEIRYGQAAKLFVPLRAPAPPSAVLSVPERYWAWTATGAGGRVQPVVSAFAGSPAALGRLGVTEGSERWLASLARLRGDLELEPAGAVLSTWSDDPWVGGAYSVGRPASSARILSDRLGPLAFAGEHTAEDFPSLMEGALRSGQRAARVLASL
jgi:monoamine oxidase